MTKLTVNTTVFEVPADAWCRDIEGNCFTFDAFLERIAAFHGYPAPGLIIGGKMVDLALKTMPDGSLFDAIAETGNCLPDAVQILTPCKAGNGWLKVIELGRYALTLYDKKSGFGTRVYLHPGKVASWPAIDTWFFKRKPKAAQDSRALVAEIRRAGHQILEKENVRIHPDIMAKEPVGARGLCSMCGESYPLNHGDLCRACQGQSPYVTDK